MIVTINATFELVGVDDENISSTKNTSSFSSKISNKLEESLFENVAGLVERLSLDGTDNDAKEAEIEDYCFVFKEGNHLVSQWSASVLEDTLYIEFPDGKMAVGTRDCFVNMLDYAEETLEVSTVILCFPKSRVDEAEVLRSFMYLGFEVVHYTKCNLVPESDNFIFMAYSFE